MKCVMGTARKLFKYHLLYRLVTYTFYCVHDKLFVVGTFIVLLKLDVIGKTSFV